MRLFAFSFLALLPVLAQESSTHEWRYYGGDAGGSRYSPLSQIHRGNVEQLKVAWVYHTGDISDGKIYPTRSAFECTPLVINGVMYLTTPFSRAIALEPESGRQLWAFDPNLDKKRRYNLLVNRGLAYWRNGGDERLFLGTLDGRLFALDARNGAPVKSFGENGSIDLRKGMADGYPEQYYGMTSPALIFKDLVITGSAVSDGEPQGPNGDVRAFDARSGKLVWRFHAVPRPGEFGNDTWEKDSWRERGGANVWSLMSCDEKRGIVYLPLTSPSPDRYGGERKGRNLFGNSLVALDAATGRRLWHFQIVHHDLWDYDLPAQPTLVTARGVPAVAQITKMGFLFVFNRITGEPIFPIEERSAPASDVPGEQAWPTQPVPVRPPPVARQTMATDEISSVTPESRAECLKLLEGAKLGAQYQPAGLEFTVIFPGTNGGPDWGGASYDPTSNLLFVNSSDAGQLVKMVNAPEGKKAAFQARSTPNARFWDSSHYPCQKPPWGTLTAIDLNTGAFRWQVPLGVVDDLLARGVPPTGTPNMGGSIVTAGGLVFIAATNDKRFRAFDKDTGKELWVTMLEASGHATPMTYKGRKTGKQYIVIAAGGGNKYNDTFGDSLVAFTIP